MSRRSLLRLFPLFVLAIGLPSQIQAQVQLDRLFPCVVQSGKRSTIKAEGKFPAWPVSLVADREDLQWEAEDEAGSLAVTVPEGTPPGIVWLRMTDETSSSDLVPLLITTAPTLIETEPNQTAGEANPVTTPIAVCGKLGKSGDLDAYRLSAKSGESINVSLTANRILASPMDAVLQIADIRGNVLAQEDDTRGLDPSIRFVAPEDGEYLIRVFAFPETPNSTIGYAGAATFVYGLTIARAEKFVEHFLPMEFTGGRESDRLLGQTRAFGWQLPQEIPLTLTKATPVSPRVASGNGFFGWQWIPEIDDSELEGIIETSDSTDKTTAAEESLKPHQVPFSFSGHLATQKEVDSVTFEVQAGLKYRASINSKRFGYPIDTELKIVDSNSGEIIASNDDQSRNDYDSSLVFTAKEDGRFIAEIRDAVDGYGPHHAYTLKVQKVQPHFSLSVTAQSYKIEPSKTLEVTVNVSRQDGFNFPIEISLAPFPDADVNSSITAQPVTSAEKGDTAKTVKLIVSASDGANFQGWFRIVGRSIEGDKTNSETTSTATYSLRPEIALKNLWLNAKPSK